MTAGGVDAGELDLQEYAVFKLNFQADPSGGENLQSEALVGVPVGQNPGDAYVPQSINRVAHHSIRCTQPCAVCARVCTVVVCGGGVLGVCSSVGVWRRVGVCAGVCRGVCRGARAYKGVQGYAYMRDVLVMVLSYNGQYPWQGLL